MTPLIIAYLLNIIDYIFTARLVSKYGVEIEASPIGRWCEILNRARALKD